MGTLDSVIRPFQTPDVSVEQPYVASGQKSSDPVLVQIGRGGNGKVFSGSNSLKITYYSDAAENETHSF